MTAPEEVVAKQAVGINPESSPQSGEAPWSRLWHLSARVCETKGWRGLRDRIRFVLKARSIGDSLRPFMRPVPGSALDRALAIRPELIGAVVWPYICVNWDAQQRLARIRDHFRLVEGIGERLDFAIDQSVLLLDLGDLQPGLRVVLDQPRWFMREGQLVLNLFDGDSRIYSIAFSLAEEDGALAVYVGAIQGGNTDGVMADYKDLTKTLHGMRPRDFLVELLRSLCRSIGVSRIYAVADASRQHRSSYFGDAKSAIMSLNYDEIWTERAGTRISDDFFSLALDAPLKPLEEVASKKRAMYRRRYDMLAEIDGRLDSAWKA